MRYVIHGTGVAAAQGATAGIIALGNTGANIIVDAWVYEWAIGPAAVAEDSNYAVQIKRQTTAGAWTSTVTPAPLELLSPVPVAIISGGVGQIVAGTASTTLGTFGFNQRGGYRWVAVPGGEYQVPARYHNGIVWEYTLVAGTAKNVATVFYTE
jgi:hypothetical protein